ncbi:MAG: zf-HC2 domain-containing protein [Candidatus Aminicenantes bacterium]|nr:zf-HC2 domain-containing protein [Candidatus Aminicenantes bacterium]
MTCQDIKEIFPDFLIGDLSQEEKEQMQSHIADCPSCRKELESLNAIWTKLGVLPEVQPSERLRTRFYTMLEDYKNDLGEEKPKDRLFEQLKNWFKPVWTGRPAFQLSFSFLLLFAGLTAGYFAGGSRGRPAEISDLRQEVQSMRQTLVVSLLDQPSASERLRGVNLSVNTEKPDSGLIEALLDTLNTDSNINVRLAAVDALYLFYDNPLVKEGIAQTLSTQDSPLVQVALIDLVVSVRERRAIESLKNLIETKTLLPEVKRHAELGLQKIGM